MSQGAFVTLVGYVAQEPNIRTTKTGKTVTELRVGITPRYLDQATGEWRDAESSYFTVSCWDRLAHHVRASMHKGEPVLVRGKFKTSTYEDKDGRPRTDTRITADTVGHDLSRGIANYIKHRSKQPPAEADETGDQAQGSAEPGRGTQPRRGTGGHDRRRGHRAIRPGPGRRGSRRAGPHRRRTPRMRMTKKTGNAADTAASAVPATPY